MLEVKYDIETRLLRGWCADETRFGGLKPSGSQAVAMLDIGIPEKDIRAYLYDEASNSLIDNPDYVEPEPPRNLAQEIDEMKAKMVTSEPPDGMAKVGNIYYDPTAKEIQHIEGA